MTSTFSDDPSTSGISLATRDTMRSTYSRSIYQTPQGGFGLHVDTFGDRMRQTKRWLYDPDLGLVMGRSPRDWGVLYAACFVFILVLLLMTASFCALLWRFVNWNRPNMQGTNSLLQTPGLAFRPQPDTRTTVTHFRRGCFQTSCYPYVDHMEAYQRFYDKDLQVGDFFMDCTTVTGRREEKDKNKACVFSLDELGRVCVKQTFYGLNDGQPCYLLKLNKIFDWMPEEYQSIDEVPDAIKDIWDPEDPLWVYVKCEGDDPVSKELLGAVTYQPKGFHFKYFPFRNQQGFRSPLVMIQFQNPAFSVVLMVTCRAYARNIIHDHNQMAGQVHFEILVD